MANVEEAGKGTGLLAATEKPPLKCFMPLVPLALGVAFGFIVHVWLGGEKPSAESWMLDLGCRLLTFVFALTFWAAQTAFVARRRWHCGGSAKIKLASNHFMSYTIALGLWGVVCICALAFLASHRFGCFLFALFVLGVLAGREIGWGKCTGVKAPS